MQTPSYKRCPSCGQPAVLTMQICQRCGQPYFVPPVPHHTVIRERPWRPKISYATVGFLLVGAMTVIAVAWSYNRSAGSTQSPNLTQVPGSGFAGQSPFVERPSKLEQPTITFTRNAESGITARFWNAEGRSWNLDIEPFQTRSLILPAGDYEYRIVDANPSVASMEGDATFRRFKNYDLTIVVDSGEPRYTHLGD